MINDKIKVCLLLFLLIHICLQVNGQNSKLDSILMERSDSIWFHVNKFQGTNDNLLEQSKENIEFASKIIDWTGAIFSAFTLLFLIAGIIGFRELSALRALRSEMTKQNKEMHDELNALEETKREIQKEIEELKTKIASDSKIILKTIYLLNDGILSYHNGKLKDAEYKFEKILGLNEKDYEATCYLARCYFGIGDQTLGIETAKAILLSESPTTAYNIIGECFRKLKKYDESIDAYEKSLSFEKRSSTFSSLGYTFFKKKDYDSAIHSFRKAIKERKYSTPVLGLIKSYIKKKQQIHQVNKYIEEAIALAEDEINHGTIYVWSIYNLSFGLLLKNKKRACLKSLKEALEKNPNAEIIKDPYYDYLEMVGEEIVPQELLNDCIKMIREKIEAQINLVD